jgi:hypothetical protein
MYVILKRNSNGFVWILPPMLVVPAFATVGVFCKDGDFWCRACFVCVAIR